MPLTSATELLPLEQEACLCAAVPFDPALLAAIPKEVVSRDYGCGDPTRWVRPGDRVLDLGSGSGKNAFICSQLVGAEGSVLGLDRNPNMLELANSACGSVASQIGYGNVSFRRAEIDQLAEDLDGQPLLADGCIDVVLSNCVLNLVQPSRRAQLLQEIRRVTAPGGAWPSATSFATSQCRWSCSRIPICGAVASVALGWNPSSAQPLSSWDSARLRWLIAKKNLGKCTLALRSDPQP